MRKREDITRQVFGRLTVKELLPHSKVACDCVCGKKIIVRAGDLKSHRTRSCGCLNKEILKSRGIDLIHRRFGMLLVLRQLTERSKCGSIKWECICGCGKTSFPTTGDLLSGKSQSCGCQMGGTGREVRHGLSYTKIYRTWASIKNRCYNINSKAYLDYGGRGIKVAECWRQSFEVFLKDVGFPPTPEHEIDRINNNGDYEPGNCRWVLTEVQNRNKRDTIKIMLNGKEVCLAEACRIVGVKYSLISQRLKSKTNWSFEEAIKVPSGKGRNREEPCNKP